jgi:hypothetical protein
MSKNLRRFNSEADYNAATLNYPAVSWVTGTDAVHFDKAAPADLSKVMMAFQSTTAGEDVILWKGGASLPPPDLFTDLTVNDVDVMGDVDAGGTLTSYTQANTTYVAKYGLIDDTYIDSTFSGSLGINALQVELFIPSSVSSIEALPDNANKVVIDNETVPTISLEWSSMNSIDLYVPDSALSAYQTALGGHWSGSINGLSDYSGNLPL